MIEFRPNYNFGYFTPHGVTPKPDIIGKLISAFRQWNFIPTTTPSFQIGNIQSADLLQLITEKKDWAINFEPIRFLLQWQNAAGLPLGNVDEFINKVSELMNVLKQLFPIKANRLSYSTKGLCCEMSEEKLNNINKRLFNLPGIYSTKKPFEWSTRQVARYDEDINDKSETLNIITDIKRLQGFLKKDEKQIPFDRIEFGFDINTYQGNQSQRFSIDDVVPFLKQAVDIENKLLSEFEGVIGGTN